MNNSTKMLAFIVSSSFFMLVTALLITKMDAPKQTKFNIKVICDNRIAMLGVGTDKNCNGSIEIKGGRFHIECDDGRRYSVPKENCSTEYSVKESK